MNEVKIIHCADLHIGMDITGIGNKSRSRKSELKLAFLNIIELCTKEQVDLLLIAGDFFDNNNVEKNDAEDVIRAVASLKKTKVFIAPGNHDYFNPSSVYNTLKWPENTYIFKGICEIREIPELGVRIMGAGFTAPYVNNGMLTGNSMPSDDMINIGIFHGELTGKNGTSCYNPITERDLDAGNFDYLALGHIHKQTAVLHRGKTYYAYSGCPEGHGFDEIGIKGVYIGSISKEKCDLKYVRICKRIYDETNIDITNTENTTQICNLIQNCLKEKYGTEYSENLYKIILSGEIGEGVYINFEDIKSVLSDSIYYLKMHDETSIKIDFEALRKNASLKGTFVTMLLDEIKAAKANNDQEKAEQYELALKIGIKAFMGEVKYDED